MDDFRKPYEYTEEKRGFILLFIFMLITLDIYQASVYIVPAYGDIKHISALRIAFLVISILYVILIPYTALTCYKLKKNLVKISKVYLVIRAVFISCCVVIIFLYNYDIKSKIGYSKQYSNLFELLFTGLIMPLIFVLIFSIGWYLFFLNSKRCKELLQSVDRK